MIKFLAHFAVLLSVVATQSHAQGPNKLNAQDILSWPRATLPEFGCLLEKELGYKHPKFNCALKAYKNKGDPCKNTEAYYEGIEFQKKYAAKIHPSVSNIVLTWEHGDLQSASFEFSSKLSSEEIRKRFKLPVEKSNPRPNVMNYDIQDCHKEHNCLTLQGFDHMGAGDVECESPAVVSLDEKTLKGVHAELLVRTLQELGVPRSLRDLTCLETLRKSGGASSLSFECNSPGVTFKAKEAAMTRLFGLLVLAGVKLDLHSEPGTAYAVVSQLDCSGSAETCVIR